MPLASSTSPALLWSALIISVAAYISSIYQHFTQEPPFFLLVGIKGLRGLPLFSVVPSQNLVSFKDDCSQFNHIPFFLLLFQSIPPQVSCVFSCGVLALEFIKLVVSYIVCFLDLNTILVEYKRCFMAVIVLYC